MCYYIQQIPLCGHPPPTLLSYANCTIVLQQLMRIDDQSSWEPDTIDKLPFDVPDDCDPNPYNTYVLYTADYCGWECRNNHANMLDVSSSHEVMGMPDAGYGPGNERLGIGWRDD